MTSLGPDHHEELVGTGALDSAASGVVRPDTSVLDDPARWVALRRLGPALWEPSAALDRLTAFAAQLLGTQHAQVSILRPDGQVVPSAYGIGHLDGPAGAAVATPLDASLCTVTAARGATLVVPDTARHPWVADLPPVTSGLVGSYCGVPLQTSTGDLVGVLCVFDRHARPFDEAACTALEALATAAVAEIELRAANLSLEATAARLERVVTAAELAGWEWRIPTDELVWDEPMYSLAGVDRATWDHTLGSFLARIHPDDVRRTTESIEAAIAACTTYEAEYRIALGDGAWRWIRAWGRALRGRTGIAERLVGVAVDSTRLRLERDHVARALEHMTDGFLSVDGRQHIEYVNGAGAEALGRTRVELIGTELWKVMSPGAATAYRAAFDECRRSGRTVTFEHFEARGAQWWEVRVLPQSEGAAIYLHEITKRRRREQERAELLAHHQTVSQALQAAVIPERLPQIPNVALAARYRPADAEVSVGGDWYDAFSIAPGRVILAVGDVAGHGLGAASVMGQLRNALRAFVMLGKGPGRVLMRLNELLVRLEPTAMATIWLGELDQVTGVLTWASAGHPPPVLAAAGSTATLSGAVNPPIGAGSLDRSMIEHRLDLLPGAVLVAYTDGLIERRGESIDDGIDRVTRAVASCRGGDRVDDLDEVLDRVLERSLAGHLADDDVCALAVSIRS